MKRRLKKDLSPPSRLALLAESRSAFDAVRMLAPLIGAQLSRAEQGASRRVVVVPGFGSDDRYTIPMRHFLNRQGYRAEGWGLGRNMAGLNLAHTQADIHPRWQFEQRDTYRGEAGVPYLCDRFIDRLVAKHAETGEPVSLIGWSLGGYVAREAARDLPDIVDSVITMGSPTIGGPKYTAAAGVFRQRGMDLDWIEAEIAGRERKPITQPITAIYSKSDGVVSWRAAIDHHSPNVTHIEVNAAHLGMGFNPTIWRHVTAALQRAPDAIREPALDAG